MADKSKKDRWNDAFKSQGNVPSEKAFTFNQKKEQSSAAERHYATGLNKPSKKGFKTKQADRLYSKLGWKNGN